MASKSHEALARKAGYQREYRRKWREANPDCDHAAHYAKYSDSQAEYRDKIRREVFAAYGNVCTCCGESTREFLTLDHVNEDGSLWRKVIGRTTHSLCLWAIRNKFPKQLQLLCWNCNAAREFSGICPHQRACRSWIKQLYAA